MGWLLLLLLIAGSIGALRLLEMRSSFLTAAAAALLFGGAGYALQGRPTLPGAPTHRTGEQQVLPLTEARHAFYGNFSPEEHWLIMSEALARGGHTEDAVNILQNAVRRYPTDAHLWVGLGNALVDHSRGLTPPAEFAFKRAAELQPGYPAAPFFYGLALARSGDRQGAVAVWREILAGAPPKASWRPLVGQGVVALSHPPTDQPR